MGPSLRMYSSLLFLTGLLCGNTALASLQDDLLHVDTRSRLLLQASCGDTLGTVTAEQVRTVGRTYLNTLISSELQAETPGIVDQTANVLFQTAVNDFTVIKLCGSCETLIREFFDDNGRVFPNYHFTYCANTAYGWDSLHSMLVLLPLDPDTGELFDQARLRSFISLTQSQLNFGTAPTEMDLVGTMQAATSGSGLSEDALLAFLTDYLAGMMAASSGSVAIFPDKTGYGESRATQNRTTFSPQFYEQAAVVSYFTVEYYVRDRTQGCTLLDTALMVHGNGDGGFAAPFAADAIRRFPNFQILNVYAAGPPLDLETFLLDSIATMDANVANSDTQLRDELFLLAAFSFSAETPGFSNTGTGSSLLSVAMRDDIVGALSSTGSQEDLSAVLPDNLANVLNTDILELFRNANEFQIKRPCDDGSIEQNLCTEVLQASTWRVLSGLEARLRFPIELCYSNGDTLLSADQFPVENFVNAYVTVFAGPTGLNELAPVGDHEASLRSCSLSPMLFYSLNGHRPVNIEDRGDFMPALEGAQLQECPATRLDVTLEPSLAPGSTPRPSVSPSPTISSSPSMPSPTSAVAKEEYTLAATLVGAFTLMLAL